MDRAHEFSFGLFGDPIFKGDYSETVKERVGSSLPSFTPDEKQRLNGKINKLTKYVELNEYG